VYLIVGLLIMLSLETWFCKVTTMSLLVSGDEPTDFYLGDLFAQLSAVVAAKPAERINICEGRSLIKKNIYIKVIYKSILAVPL